MTRCAFLTGPLFSFGLLVLVFFLPNVMAELSTTVGSKVLYTDDVRNLPRPAAWNSAKTRASRPDSWPSYPMSSGIPRSKCSALLLLRRSCPTSSIQSTGVHPYQ